ncbi:MAG: hypothetical protein ACRD1K_01610 [Acidimicrobiales bacterium]
MTEPTTLACERHGNSTPLSCVRCDVPICWGCLVETDVGFMCERHGGRTRRPGPLPAERRQRLVLGVGAVAAVALVALVLSRVGSSGSAPSPPPPRPVEYEAVAGHPGNADFEAGPGPSGRPAGWVGGGEGYELALDTEVRHGGGASGRVRALAVTGDNRTQGGLTTCLPAVGVLGATVRVSAFLRTDGATGRATGLSMVVFGPRPDGRPGVLNGANMRRFPILGTTGWTEYRVQAVVPMTADRVCLSATLGGAGTLWVDDVVVERDGGPQL